MNVARPALIVVFLVANLVASLAAEDPPTPWAFKSAKANEAMRKYQAARKKLDEGYDKLHLENRAAFVAKLEEAVNNATKAGNLDEAVAIRDAIKLVRTSEQVEAPVAAIPPNRKKIRRGAVAYEGHHYFVYQEAMSWPDAQAACRKEGGHLVRVDTEAEFDFLTRLLIGVPRRTPWVWADLRDEAVENTWVDSDGQPPGFLRWKSGEPSRGDRQTNCGCVDYRDPTGFLDHPCSSPSSFICEWDY